jgi:hypothetical protein
MTSMPEMPLYSSRIGKYEPGKMGEFLSLCEQEKKKQAFST